MPNFNPLAESGVSMLPALHQMSVGQFLLSPSGRYKLLLKSDSLVILDNDQLIWAANGNQRYSRIYKARKQPPMLAKMSFYFNCTLPGKRTWSTVGYNYHNGDYDSATYRAFLTLQDDGNLVVTDVIPQWLSNGSLRAFSTAKVGHYFLPHSRMDLGNEVRAGAARLVLHPDGNLVSYGGTGGLVWSSNTAGIGVQYGLMQEDGNFVLYSNAGIVWQTGTAGRNGAFAQYHEDGTFSVAMHEVLWARFGKEQRRLKRRKTIFSISTPPITVFEF